MAQGRFVSYLRVSTKRQGASGLGMEAQRSAVESYLNGGSWELVAEYVEVETGKSTDTDRPQLAKALAACRIHGATLVVAKLDRLARNAAFLLNLQAAGVEFVAVDLPSANRLTVGIMALVAEEEARMISKRTKDALRAAKARGVKLGNPKNLSDAARLKGSALASRARIAKVEQRANDLAPIIREAQANGAGSLRELAKVLNDRGIPTARGGTWTATQVNRLLGRLEAAA